MIELALAITGPVCLTLLTAHVLSLRSRERLAAGHDETLRVADVVADVGELRDELQQVVDIHNAAVERMVEVEQQVQRLELAKAGQ